MMADVKPWARCDHERGIVEFVVPGRPVGKGSVRVTMHGTYMPPETKAWMRLVSDVARMACPREPWTAPVKLVVVATFAAGERPYTTARLQVVAGRVVPDALGATRKPDASNILKGVEDALTGIVWRDDSQVVRVSVCKEIGEHAAVYVRVERLADEPTQIGLLPIGPRRRRRSSK